MKIYNKIKWKTKDNIIFSVFIIYIGIRFFFTNTKISKEELVISLFFCLLISIFLIKNNDDIGKI